MIGRVFPPHSFLFTLDVTSLYTNMDLKIIYQKLAELLNDGLLVSVLHYICENNFFQYNGHVFRQKNGIAMGTKCAVELANLYLAILFDNFAIDDPDIRFYKRYIDDIVGVFSGSLENFERFFEKMDSTVPDIKFTKSTSPTHMENRRIRDTRNSKTTPNAQPR